MPRPNINVLTCERNKPKIIAIRIPSLCSMSDADEIEKLFFEVKRRSWSASRDAVWEFEIHRPDPEPNLTAIPGQYIVRVRDPFGVPHDAWYEVLGVYQFEEKYKIKKSQK